MTTELASLREALMQDQPEACLELPSHSNESLQHFKNRSMAPVRDRSFVVSEATCARGLSSSLEVPLITSPSGLAMELRF